MNFKKNALLNLINRTSILFFLTNCFTYGSLKEIKRLSVFENGLYFQKNPVEQFNYEQKKILKVTEPKKDKILLEFDSDKFKLETVDENGISHPIENGEKIFVSLRVNNCDFNLDESNYFEKVLGNIKAGDDLYSSNNKVYLPLEFRIHTEYCNLVGQTLLPSNQIYQMLISYPNQKPNAENTPIILKKKVINFNRNFYLISYSILLISVPLDIVTSPIQIASLVILNALYRGVR
jgi:hypothetical protein